jgi:hypothetical protein
MHESIANLQIDCMLLHDATPDQIAVVVLFSAPNLAACNSIHHEMPVFQTAGRRGI